MRSRDWLVILMVGLLTVLTGPQFSRFWKALRPRWKVIYVSTVSVLFLSISFLVNMHKPYARIDDAMCGVVLIFCLMLWGLYNIMSRGMDALWFRITRRK